VAGFGNLRSTPLEDLDPAIRLFEGNFLRTLRKRAHDSRDSHRLPWPRRPLDCRHRRLARRSPLASHRDRERSRPEEEPQIGQHLAQFPSIVGEGGGCRSSTPRGRPGTHLRSATASAQRREFGKALSSSFALLGDKPCLCDVRSKRQMASAPARNLGKLSGSQT
jgi:hypothetical protein